MHNLPQIFFHSTARLPKTSPELIFHTINISQDSSVSLSVIQTFYFSYFLGSGAFGMAQIDRCFNDDSFTTMIQRIQSLSYHYEGRLQLHLIGGFSDRNRVAHSLSVALLRKSF